MNVDGEDDAETNTVFVGVECDEWVKDIKMPLLAFVFVDDDGRRKKW